MPIEPNRTGRTDDPDIGDAFGMDLLAVLAGNQVFEIIERDDGNVDAVDMHSYFTTYEQWPQFERQAIALAKGKILDLGCGAGRHSLYLQEKGFLVTGIDAAPGAVETCRKRGMNDVRLLSTREIEKLQSARFDTVILFGNNLGLLESRESGKILLRKLHALTAPDAHILGTTRDPYQTKNPLHLAYHERNRKHGRMPGQVRIRVRHERTATPWFDYLFTSKPELEEILEGTGWKVQTYIDGSEPSGADRYAVVMKKE